MNCTYRCTPQTRQHHHEVHGVDSRKAPFGFDALSEPKGVYLFDEVDALAGERATPSDVSEMRRILNSFLHS